MAKTEVFISLGMSEALQEKVDDYRFKNRINSRSEAIRMLIEKSLELEEKKDTK